MKKSIIMFALSLTIVLSSNLLALTPEERSAGAQLVSKLEEINNQIKEFDNSQQMKEFMQRSKEVQEKEKELLKSKGLLEESDQLFTILTKKMEDAVKQTGDFNKARELVGQEAKETIEKLGELNKKRENLLNQSELQPERARLEAEGQLVAEQLAKMYKEKNSFSKKLDTMLQELNNNYPDDQTIKDYFAAGKALGKLNEANPKTKEEWEQLERQYKELVKQRDVLLNQIFKG